ncbi:MAG: GrpB family protein [Clostridia bacterium]
MDIPIDFVAESIKTNNQQNNKDLCDMSLIEMWALFPISLTEHNANWKNWFNEEYERLLQILPLAPTLRVSHIGSTAVATIMAKPIVDIMVEIDKSCNIKDIKMLLENNGYGSMSECDDRISLQKGYTKNGFVERVFHLHLRFFGDNDELYFRDYLLDNPKVAQEYETIKLELLKQYKYNTDAYTNAKTDFIGKITRIAKVKYKDKYN